MLTVIEAGQMGAVFCAMMRALQGRLGIPQRGTDSPIMLLASSTQSHSRDQGTEPARSRLDARRSREVRGVQNRRDHSLPN